jgi:hypothetical protein
MVSDAEIELLEHIRDSARVMAARNLALETALRQIDQTLRIPAAEYVPAIGDVFTIIDEALAYAPTVICPATGLPCPHRPQCGQ